jgi:hypothetical protein
LSAFAKKKKTGLHAPEKVSTHFTKSAPSSPALHKPEPRKAIHKAQVQRVQSPKVKPVRYQAKQRAQAQAPAYQNEDFQFITSVNNIGININVLFRGSQIFQFLLPATEYELWQRMTAWAQRYEYVKMKVPANALMNDAKLIHSVIKTIVNVLDTLFLNAQKQASQQQQQQQQRTQSQKRRM